jgi:rubrerythrin
MKIICCICGMEINSRNMNANEAAFLQKNMGEGADFCPFCGAKKRYLLVEGLIENCAKIKELDEHVLKILDHAVKLELFNSDFYRKAAVLAEDNALKRRFKDLATIEFVHARIHMRLGGFKQMPKLADINYDKYAGDRKLIEQAKLREKHAIEYYDKYIDNFHDAALKEVVQVLREVEQEHMTLLCN